MIIAFCSVSAARPEVAQFGQSDGAPVVSDNRRCGTPIWGSAFVAVAATGRNKKMCQSLVVPRSTRWGAEKPSAYGTSAQVAFFQVHSARYGCRSPFNRLAGPAGGVVER